MASGYSVSTDPREKLRLKMAQDELAKQRAMGPPGPVGATGPAGPTGRPWIPVLGPDSAASAPTTPTPEQRDKFALNARMAVGTTAPQMGPPTPDVAMRDRLQAIGVRDAILAKQTVRERYLHGQSPEFEGLRDQRFALGDEKYALDNAMRPVQQPQSPMEVVGGRQGIHYQGMKVVADKKAAAFERLRVNPNDPTARADIMEADRMGRAFEQNLPVYEGPEDPRVSGVIDRQRGAVPAQEANRNAWGERAGTMGGMNVAGEQFQIEQGMTRAKIARAEMQKKLAEAQYAGSPETIKAEGERQRIMAQTDLEKARQGSVAAQKAGSGPASPGEAAGREAQRQSGMSQVYGDEAHFQTAKTGGGALLRSAVNSLDDLYADKNVGNSARDYSTRFLPDLQRYASIDPVGAAQVAREHLAEIERHISYVPGWATNSGIQARRAQFLGPIEQELRRIAGQ